jgi:membrane associated rhomboid family serine protease
MERRRATSGGTTIKATHALCFAYFVVFIALVIGDGSAWRLGLLQALGVGDLAGVAARPWALVAHALVHQEPLEAILAAGLLLLAGVPVEERLGARRFLIFYVLSAALVGLAHVGLVEGGVATNRLLTGSLGPSIALLTAYLFLMPERRIGGVPYPMCYLAISVSLLLLVVVMSLYSDRAVSAKAKQRLDVAYNGQEPSSDDERVNLAWNAVVERRIRPNHLAHLLGFALGGVALGATLAASRYQERARVLREIRGLQEEVEVRARVDLLLEKISREGMTSLSRSERKFLSYASRFYRHGIPGSPAS